MRWKLLCVDKAVSDHNINANKSIFTDQEKCREYFFYKKFGRSAKEGGNIWPFKYLLILWSLFLGFPLYFLRCWSFELAVELRYVSTMLFKMASLSPFGITSTEDKGTRAKDIWFVLLQQFNVSAAYKKHPTAIRNNPIVIILGPFPKHLNSDVLLQVLIRSRG
jgi:hypothetical protein